MAKASGGSQRGGRRPARTSAGTAARKSPAKKPMAAPETVSVPAGPLRVGAAPGATPGTWIDRWRERMPGTPLQLVPLTLSGQRDALLSETVDVALVRMPIESDGLHIIPLYAEMPVVVCASDSHLTAADELRLADLAGEVVIVSRDAILTPDVPDTATGAFAPPETTEDAIALVATGIGIVIVPMSLARLHHRRDTAWRPLADGSLTPVGIAWRKDADSALVDTFVGIVRGRTANTSR
ncbi:LysR family substrate-binding domain-containing protein [Microbacterium sp.]|uniref:LysR family substrate-binding domain-containing protein n=1 Tax=Microbacterium sp. TaxID=51671 RepID=UPI0025F2EAF4|nr:LysR family substrate-binding domain-containing protein [Microbacterium sp.]